MSNLRLPPNCSISELVDAVIAALQDPYKPTLCGGTLAMAVDNIDQGEYMSTCEVTTHQRANFYGALYGFMVAPRLPGTLKDWMDEFATCNDCTPAHRCEGPTLRISSFYHLEWIRKKSELVKLHADTHDYLSCKRKEDRFHPASWTFLNKATTALCNVFRNTPFKQFVLERSTKWPTNLPSLMELGPDNIIESLVQWYQFSPNPMIPQLLTAIAACVRYPMHEALGRVGFIPMVAAATKNIVDLAMTTLERSHHDPPHAHQFLLETFVAHFIAFYKTLEAFNEYYLPGDLKLQLMDDHGTKVVQMCTLIDAVLPAIVKRLEDFESEFAGLGSDYVSPRSLIVACRIHRDFRVDLVNDSNPGLKQSYRIAAFHLKTFFGPYDGFEAEMGLSSILSNGFESGCSCAACPKTPGDAYSTIKTCQGCLGVYYCGSSCERLDWEDEEYPHKMICPIIRKVVAAFRPVILMKEGSTKELRKFGRGPSDMHTIKNIRGLISQGKLSASETETLKGWGKKIYYMHSIDAKKLQWHPGYEDYERTLKRIHDRPGVYLNSKFAIFLKVPSKGISREKEELRSIDWYST